MTTKRTRTAKKAIERADAAGEDAGVASADVPQGIVSEPIPNVQSETAHASQAPEDVRDAQVAEPNA